MIVPLTSTTAAVQPGNLDDGALHKAPARVMARFRQMAEEGKASIASSLDDVVTSAREIAGKLEASGGVPVANYVHRAADAVSSWSADVNDKSIDDLFYEARGIVRRSPAIASGVVLIAAVAIMRVLKAEAVPILKTAGGTDECDPASRTTPGSVVSFPTSSRPFS